MTAAGWAVLALILAALVAVVVLWLRDRRKDAESAWKERAGANDSRADAAEAVAGEVADIAAGQQADIQKEIHDAATERLAHPDPDARRRVQERWKRTDPASRADDPPAGAAAVPDATTSGSGPGAAGTTKLRGRR